MTTAPPFDETAKRAGIVDTLETQPFMTLLGVRLGDIGPGVASMSMPLRADLLQHTQSAHAGATTALVDNTCAAAAFTLMGPGQTVVSVEFKINFLRLAKGERLIAEARVMKPGRAFFVCQGDVYGEEGDTRTHVAHMVATMAVIPAEGR